MVIIDAEGDIVGTGDINHAVTVVIGLDAYMFGTDDVECAIMIVFVCI